MGRPRKRWRDQLHFEDQGIGKSLTRHEHDDDDDDAAADDDDLPTDFHICYPSTHTDINPLTHIYSPVYPSVGISTRICCSTNRVPNTGTLINTCNLWILVTSWRMRKFTSIAHLPFRSDCGFT